jgi:F-type H+-transporting ATPase subunit c
VRIILVMMVLVIGLAGGPALAQQAAAAHEPAAGGWLGPFTVVAAGIGMALAAGLCGLGQGRAIAAALEGMARQPGAAARIQTAMIIGLALIESLAIYTLVIAIILLFANPFK